MAPRGDGGRVAPVHLDAGEQRLRALLLQPGVERAAETAVVAVVAVAQRQHGVMEPGQIQFAAHHAADEGNGGVRRIAFAAGAGDEQHTLRLAQLGRIEFGQRAQAHRHASKLQGGGRLHRQLFRAAALAGVHHQAGAARGGSGGGLARRAALAAHAQQRGQANQDERSQQRGGQQQA